MAQLGADDVQVDQLAATFKATATRLTTAESTITSLVRSVRWTGPDADQFRGRWNGTMRSQLVNVSDRLDVLAKELLAQAEAQRTASAATGAGAGGGGGSGPSLWEEIREIKRNSAEAMLRLARANAWAEGEGRDQLRDVTGRSEAAQREWWTSLTDDQRAALMRNLPGELYGLDGLPADVRADARASYIDSAREDLELRSTEDKIEGELNIAWVHLGVEGSAAIVEQADGTYRVDLELDGEIGANVGAKGAQGNVGIGAGVAQSYEFDSQAEAEAFVNGLYEKLSPDIDASFLKGPGGLMSDTVNDVVNYLGDHSDARTSFEGELRLDGDVELKLGAVDVSVSGEAGGRYDFDTGERTLFVGGSIEGSYDLPSAGNSTAGSASMSAELEVALVFDDNGEVSSLDFSGTLGGEGSVGIEHFLNGTGPQSATPQTLNVDAAGGADVRFDASMDLQDPRAQEAAATMLRNLGSGGVTLNDLQAMMRESDMQIQIDATSSSSEGFDVGIASLEISHNSSANLFTWVKPAGGEITRVTGSELMENHDNV